MFAPPVSVYTALAAKPGQILSSITLYRRSERRVSAVRSAQLKLVVGPDAFELGEGDAGVGETQGEEEEEDEEAAEDADVEVVAHKYEFQDDEFDEDGHDESAA